MVLLAAPACVAARNALLGLPQITALHTLAAQIRATHGPPDIGVGLVAGFAEAVCRIHAENLVQRTISIAQKY